MAKSQPAPTLTADERALLTSGWALPPSVGQKIINKFDALAKAVARG